MDITLRGADEYYDLGNHIDAAQWSAYEEPQRSGALASAERQLSRALRRPMGSGPHDAEAVYEQALWLLKTHVVATGGSAMPYPVAQDAELAQGATPLPEVKVPYSDEALRWLGWNGVTTIRG